jgi:hypothetical protein
MPLKIVIRALFENGSLRAEKSGERVQQLLSSGPESPPASG